MKTPIPSGYKTRAINDDHVYLEGPKSCPSISVRKRDSAWYITNSDERIPAALQYVPYPTPELALTTGLEICRNHDRMMKEYAVPKPLQDAIERAERGARELEQGLRSLNARAHFARWEIDSLRKAAGMPPHRWDEDDLVKRLNEMSLDGDMPFFSEGYLYDLLGKDDARSVLGLIAEVKKKLDPIGGAV